MNDCLGDNVDPRLPNVSQSTTKQQEECRYHFQSFVSTHSLLRYMVSFLDILAWPQQQQQQLAHPIVSDKEEKPKWKYGEIKSEKRRERHPHLSLFYFFPFFCCCQFSCSSFETVQMAASSRCYTEMQWWKRSVTTCLSDDVFQRCYMATLKRQASVIEAPQAGSETLKNLLRYD